MAIALAATFNCIPVRAFIPLPDANGQYAVDEKGNLLVGQISVSNFPAFDKGGSFQGTPELNQMLGYDPSRSWSAGTRPEDVLTYGDFKQYGLHELTIKELNPDVNLNTVSLEELNILEGKNLNELIRTVPNLKNQKVKNVAPLKDMLPEHLEDYSLGKVVRKNVELAETIESDARAEITQTAQQLADRQQEHIHNGINRGLEYVSQRIVDSYRQSYPKLENRELETIAARARQEMREELALITHESKLKFTDELSLTSLADLDRQVNKYTTQVNVLIEETALKLESKIGLEINNRLADAGFEQLPQIPTSVEDIQQAVKNHTQELIGHTKTQIAQKITEKRKEVRQLKQSLPEDIGEIKIADYDLSNYSINDIPGLEDVKVKEFKNYERAVISSIPGTKDLSFDRYPFKFNFGTGIALIDWVFGEAEGYANRAISGSIRETFSTAHCERHNSLNGGCAHIELIAPQGTEILDFNSGKQWVSGDSQETKGGRNLLQNYKGGKEPTGRLPVPESLVKMVLRNNDELKDTTDLYLAFQFCMTDIFGNRHCTPHNVAELYLMTFEKGDYIFLGVSPI